MWLYFYPTSPLLLTIARLSHPAFQAEPTETSLGGESGYTEEIALRSGSSDRHGSNLLLDILLTCSGAQHVIEC